MIERKVELSQFVNGKWQEIPVSGFSGLTLPEITRTLDGSPFVGRVESEKGVAYFAGTPELIDVLRKRGKMNVINVERFLEVLELTESNLRDAMVPDVVSEIAGSIVSFCALDDR